MVHASITPASEVLTIIGWLMEKEIVYQVNGGWGVDALVGRQTREHGDLDVFVDAVFTHPAVARTRGSIDGVPVIVGTAERLRELRNGYDPRPEDEHDLGILSRLHDSGAGQQPG